mmetsp:Transcript_35033/g.105615  ORF Transcript_35033/g.105615 Transcript_35033/m.105615 type:complete len:348 (+) Transcript_35033:242-1285(+)
MAMAACVALGVALLHNVDVAAAAESAAHITVHPLAGHNATNLTTSTLHTPDNGGGARLTAATFTAADLMADHPSWAQAEANPHRRHGDPDGWPLEVYVAIAAATLLGHPTQSTVAFGVAAVSRHRDLVAALTAAALVSTVDRLAPARRPAVWLVAYFLVCGLITAMQHLLVWAESDDGLGPAEAGNCSGGNGDFGWTPGCSHGWRSSNEYTGRIWSRDPLTNHPGSHQRHIDGDGGSPLPSWQAARCEIESLCNGFGYDAAAAGGSYQARLEAAAARVGHLRQLLPPAGRPIDPRLEATVHHYSRMIQTRLLNEVRAGPGGIGPSLNQIAQRQALRRELRRVAVRLA